MKGVNGNEQLQHLQQLLLWKLLVLVLAAAITRKGKGESRTKIAHNSRQNCMLYYKIYISMRRSENYYRVYVNKCDPRSIPAMIGENAAHSTVSWRTCMRCLLCRRYSSTSSSAFSLSNRMRAWSRSESFIYLFIFYYVSATTDWIKLWYNDRQQIYNIIFAVLDGTPY